ncbi:AIR synthase-related protein [Enterocloster asparagiformis]|nr:AIR synthase-related protein [Enterocloster asparagiformis]
MRPGQDLIMAGYAGLDGACGIARARREELERRFCSAFLKQLAGSPGPSPVIWAGEHLGADITAYEVLGEGGVLAALWNLSGVFNAGIEFDLRRIPIRQATVEICELYGLNPYRLRSGGGFMAAADNGGRAVRALEAAGIPAAVIGSVIPGTARRMSHGGESAGFLERPQPDEYDKICGDERQT